MSQGNWASLVVVAAALGFLGGRIYQLVRESARRLKFYEHADRLIAAADELGSCSPDDPAFPLFQAIGAIRRDRKGPFR